ncbi:unnamed protein product [Schistosoma rodhaini]|uniref:Scavenger receptor class B member 1 n=2 Tax=Schistosoma mansoni TaxID=6183 RepID=A0A5K4FAW2_SCHMA|nr:unnamed protein product [Schistosoma rodhaini]
MIIRILITFIIISFILLCALHPSIWFILHKELCLKNNSQLYQNWLKPSLPIMIQFYFFNITNPYEFQNGAKPILKQLGPYTFDEKRYKYNIKHNYFNGTIEYQEYKQYYFNPNLSIGHENDLITHVNLGFVAIATKLNTLPWTINYLIELFEKYHHYKLIQIKTIKQLLWGYNDEFLTLLSNYGLNISQTKIGLLLNRNNTLSPTILMNDGLKNYKNQGKILEFHHQNHLNYWTTKIANMINGTDGTIYHLFMDKVEKPYVFAYDLCRSIQLMKHSETQISNLPVYKYILSEDTFKSGETFEKNKGFCLNWSNCFKDGVLDMSSCQPNAPVVVSQPHFLNADKSYQTAIDNIQYNNEEYNTSIYIEPITGLIINASIKLQINVIIKKNPKIEQLRNLSDILLPLVYFNETVYLNQPIINQLNKVLIQIPMIIQIILMMIIIFNGIWLCSILFKLFIRNNRSMNDGENQWLLSPD